MCLFLALNVSLYALFLLFQNVIGKILLEMIQYLKFYLQKLIILCMVRFQISTGRQIEAIVQKLSTNFHHNHPKETTKTI